MLEDVGLAEKTTRTDDSRTHGRASSRRRAFFITYSPTNLRLLFNSSSSSSSSRGGVKKENRNYINRDLGECTLLELDKSPAMLRIAAISGGARGGVGGGGDSSSNYIIPPSPMDTMANHHHHHHHPPPPPLNQLKLPTFREQFQTLIGALSPRSPRSGECYEFPVDARPQQPVPPSVALPDQQQTTPRVPAPVVPPPVQPAVQPAPPPVSTVIPAVATVTPPTPVPRHPTKLTHQHSVTAGANSISNTRELAFGAFDDKARPAIRKRQIVYRRQCAGRIVFALIVFAVAASVFVLRLKLFQQERRLREGWKME